MMILPTIGETWKHFKGDLYVIEGFCWDAMGDELVLRVRYIKEKNHEGPPYSRTIENFIGPADTRAPARFVKIFD
jgi:hypothetical protein